MCAARFHLLTLCFAAAAAAPIALDGSGAWQRYDGHGGLSAGASSRLLLDYPEPQRSQILDYLFLPSFGASLHMNKIEIGGDTQSTDGTEPSYRHSRSEAPLCGPGVGENRGYEMWLLQEGYKRNPAIQTYLLSWGVPRWVGNATYFSAENIEYQVAYADCVRQTTGHTPTYLGIWNERSWGTVDYVLSLRAALDAAGLDTKIVLPDGGDCAGVTAAAAQNATFAAAVHALGEHYPCKRACPATADLGLAFWASEDYSTVADWAGAGCWGRSLSQNWVLLNATSTISWSTIWSVYASDSYYGNGLMYAYSPWSGHYEVNPSIWTSAHWTQFMDVGWHLLQGPAGRGLLPAGGSYVAARSPAGDEFTLVLESLEGACLRCAGGAVPAQDLLFSLSGGLPAAGAALAVWQTTEAAPFVPLPDVTVAADGTLALHLPADAMLTVSTRRSARHGSFALPIPADAPFPLPYADSFDNASVYTAPDRLPRFFGDQAGSFAVRAGVVQQVVPADPGPNGWGPNRDPFSLLGDAAWTDVAVSVRVSFDGSPPDGATAADMPPPPPPAAPAVTVHNAPALVRACNASAPSQHWQFGAVARNYLSLADDAGGVCLDLPGCDAGAALDYYSCVTTGCLCGCPGFQNLQYELPPGGGQLTTPVAPGACVAARADGTLALLAPCAAGAAGTRWTYDAATRLLAVSDAPGAGGAPRCLAADPAPPPPPPPPPPQPYAALTARVPSYDGGHAHQGVTFAAMMDGTFRILVGSAVAANGSLPQGGGGAWNSSAWHTLGLAVKGQAIAATLDGAPVWAGSDGTYSRGQVAIGCGYHRAAFDDFAVAPAA